MFWRMNTETYYEVSKFALISKCELGEGEGESLTNPKSGRKLYALILTLNIAVENSRKTETPRKCILRHLERPVGGACRTY